MTERLLLALAQLNPVVGDVSGNLAKLRKARSEAAKQGAHLLLTTELFLSGYPLEDLVVKPSFQSALQYAIKIIQDDTADGGPAVLLGAPWVEHGRLHNAVLFLNQGQIKSKIFKQDLPNYGPFDEKRTFKSAPLPEPILFRDVSLGVMICEDMWTKSASAHLNAGGAQVVLVVNGSPYETGKREEREHLARQRAQETGLPFIYLNQVGGQDELVFDGASFVLNYKGECIYRAKAWEEDLVFLPLPISEDAAVVPNKTAVEADIYHALMLGLRDYVRKNGFTQVVLGLSGGIDSALVAALAVDALGPENVWCVMLPSPYTSMDSHEDALAITQNLKCRYDIMPITESMASFEKTLAKTFKGKKPDLTEENIQARCRGILLMALSNKFGHMVLATGNKSEMAVGYSTLYGDLCGGFAALKDVYKTEVYKIAHWRNANLAEGGLGPRGAIIPKRILTKAPTAELRPNQKDQDSLPLYDELDAILFGLIEQDLGVEDLVKQGHNAATIKRVWSLLDKAEYKRRQAPPGVKITRRNLGKDRRYPITNRYREG